MAIDTIDYSDWTVRTVNAIELALMIMDSTLHHRENLNGMMMTRESCANCKGFGKQINSKFGYLRNHQSASATFSNAFA